MGDTLSSAYLAFLLHVCHDFCGMHYQRGSGFLVKLFRESSCIPVSLPESFLKARSMK